MNTFAHAVDGKPRPARRVTVGTLSGCHGPDRGRPLIVTLEAGDVICFRPKGTRRRHAASAFDVFAWIARCEAQAKAREKLLRRKGWK